MLGQPVHSAFLCLHKRYTEDSVGIFESKKRYANLNIQFRN